jgi:hypothetical protein
MSLLDFLLSHGRSAPGKNSERGGSSRIERKSSFEEARVGLTCEGTPDHAAPAHQNLRSEVSSEGANHPEIFFRLVFGRRAGKVRDGCNKIRGQGRDGEILDSGLVHVTDGPGFHGHHPLRCRDVRYSVVVEGGRKRTHEEGSRH